MQKIKKQLKKPKASMPMDITDAYETEIRKRIDIKSYDKWMLNFRDKISTQQQKECGLNL